MGFKGSVHYRVQLRQQGAIHLLLLLLSFTMISNQENPSGTLLRTTASRKRVPYPSPSSVRTSTTYTGDTPLSSSFQGAKVGFIPFLTTVPYSFRSLWSSPLETHSRIRTKTSQLSWNLSKQTSNGNGSYQSSKSTWPPSPIRHAI